MKKEFVLLLLLLLAGACTNIPDESEPVQATVAPEEILPNVTEQPEIITPEENIALSEPVTIEEPEEDEPEEPDFGESWNDRIDAALASSSCPTVIGPTYGDTVYTGPLIDTHYHIANIPDYPPEEEGNPEEVDPNEPLLGVTITIADTVCTLKRENTDKAFAFFPVYPEIPEQMAEVAKQTMDKYPDYFVPFIMPPDHDDDPDGFPTVDAEELEDMLGIYPGLFEGYGEIGLYARQGGSPELAPDAERLEEIYPVIREHNLVVYFHLGEGHKENIENAAAANPDINFIFHGDQLISYAGGRQHLEDIEEILSDHPNVYYTVDELYGDELMISPDRTKEQFLDHLENYEELLDEDWNTWKGVIERHPDQFMWGTDRSDQVVWSHDPDVGQALANYARAFIAGLDPDLQEKFAYKNAENVLQ